MGKKGASEAEAQVQDDELAVALGLAEQPDQAKAEPHSEAKPDVQEQKAESQEKPEEGKDKEKGKDKGKEEAKPLTDEERLARRIQSEVDKARHQVELKYQKALAEQEARIREELARQSMSADEFQRWKADKDAFQQTVQKAALAMTSQALHLVEEQVLDFAPADARDTLQTRIQNAKTFREVLEAAVQARLEAEMPKLREAVRKELLAEEIGGTAPDTGVVGPVSRKVDWRKAPAHELIASGLLDESSKKK